MGEITAYLVLCSWTNKYGEIIDSIRGVFFDKEEAEKEIEDLEDILNCGIARVIPFTIYLNVQLMKEA